MMFDGSSAVLPQNNQTHAFISRLQHDRIDVLQDLRYLAEESTIFYGCSSFISLSTSHAVDKQSYLCINSCVSYLSDSKQYLRIMKLLLDNAYESRIDG